MKWGVSLALGAMLALGACTRPGGGGDGPVARRSSALDQSVIPFDGVKSIAGGLNHLCALRNDGTVWCWGYNFYGQLGDGSTVNSSTPVRVSGITRAIEIAVGANHSCAIAVSGLFCWGLNDDGQLGDGTNVSSRTPVAVADLMGVTGIVAGSRHTCALGRTLANGNGNTPYCWGANDRAQLGTPTGQGSNIPVEVAVGPLQTAPVMGISARNTHTCAIVEGGQVACWGDLAPPAVVPGLIGVFSVAAGANHTCAALANSIALCWGSNKFGQLGDGNPTVDSATPVVVAGPANVASVIAGDVHTCALMNDRTVECWGDDARGELGPSLALTGTGGSATPVVVPGVVASAIATTESDTCAVLTGGTVECWGDNQYGELGNGTPEDVTTPARIPDLANVLSVSASYFRHRCAALADGTAECWGTNVNGQLGNGTMTGSRTPVLVSGPFHDFVSIVNGAYHTCALQRSGAVWCWGGLGDSPPGVLGDGQTAGSMTPVPVSGLDGAVAISAGAYHTCALLADGTARCWGTNDAGKLGNGGTTTALVPTPVSGLAGIVSISAGATHTCAALNDGTARCWGTNQGGELGDGTKSDSSVPVPVLGLSGVLEVAAGQFETCALLSDRTVTCWGRSFSTGHPVAGLANVASLSGGAGGLMCALVRDGSVECWGSDTHGELGIGSETTESLIPVPAVNVTNARSVSAGESLACAALVDGSVRCWGLDSSGVLGVPSMIETAAPTTVLSAICGDGLIQVGEDCDPPDGLSCDAQCHAIPQAGPCVTCEMEAGNAPVGSPAGSRCAPSVLTVPSTGGFGCDGFSGSQRASCVFLLECIRSRGCLVGSDPGQCYCGSRDSVTCVSAGPAPDSPCLAEYEAALVGGPPGSIPELFTNATSPIGIADNLASCDGVSTCGDICHLVGPLVGSGAGGGAGAGSGAGGAGGAGGSSDAAGDGGVDATPDGAGGASGDAAADGRDKGAICTSTPQCATGLSCVDGVCCLGACGAGDTHDCQACSVAAGGTKDGECTTIPKDTHVCRDAAGVCDEAESCDGNSVSCPDDGFLTGTTCRPAAVACDVPEVCGASAQCPPNAFAPALTCGAVSPSSSTLDLNQGAAVDDGITFHLGGDVTAPGELKIVQPEAGFPPPPPNFKVVASGTNLLQWDFSTTASYDGSITICVKYPTGDALFASAMQLVHDDGQHTCLMGGVMGPWCPLAPSALTNKTNRVFCGVLTCAPGVECFSPFALIEPLPTPPVVTVPGTVVAEATGPGGASVAFAAAATDALDGPITPTCSPASGSNFPLGDTTVNCTATDSLGLSGSASFVVTVHDSTAPPLPAVPGTIVAYATSTTGAKVSYATPTSVDLVDGPRAAICAPASGTMFAPGTTRVSCTATDAHGNTSAPATFTVWVQYQDSADGSFYAQPINPDGSSIFKGGSTIPVKFQIQGASAGITNLVAHIFVARVSNSITGTYVEAASSSNADSGNVFRYDASAHQYIFNLSTKGLTTGTWSIRADLGDGVDHTIVVSLK